MEQINLGYQEFPNKVFATMQVNGKEKKFQLDTEATANMMSDATFAALCGHKQLCNLEESNSTLIMYMYNHTEEVRTIGKTRVRLVNCKNNKRYSVEFVIPNGNFKSLLG